MNRLRTEWVLSFVGLSLALLTVSSIARTWDQVRLDQIGKGSTLKLNKSLNLLPHDTTIGLDATQGEDLYNCIVELNVSPSGYNREIPAGTEIVFSGVGGAGMLDKWPFSSAKVQSPQYIKQIECTYGTYEAKDDAFSKRGYGTIEMLQAALHGTFTAATSLPLTEASVPNSEDSQVRADSVYGQ